MPQARSKESRWEKGFQSTAPVQKGYSGAKSKIDTILGVVFIGLGIRLVAAR
jgi:hypothetical protein